MVFLDVPGRLAKIPARARPDRVGTCRSPRTISRQAIGSTRATVNKLLADFERRDLIRVDR